MALDALRSSPLLGGLSDAALERLRASGAELEVGQGAVVLEEGTQPDAMFVLLEGELEVRKRVGDEDVQVGLVGPGELIGEQGLLHRRPRSARVRATRPSRLLQIPGEALDDLLGNARAARAMLATATRRLERQELLLQQHERMAALGSLTAGLLHELNNPAAAVRRAVEHLAERVEAVRAADRELVEHAPGGLAERLSEVAARPGVPPADPLARADAEEQWLKWLERRDVAAPWTLAGTLGAAGVAVGTVESLLADEPPEAIGPSARSLAAGLALRRSLEEAGTGASRIADIVGAVKTFSHHGEAPVGDVDVHQGLESALTLLRHKIPDGVGIRRELAGGLPLVEGCASDLNVVWTNLIDNALDAVGERGQIVLATRSEPDEVIVEVTDDGPGIPPGVAERMFDPFYTTKPVGKGTGMGLATSEAIVRQRHRGRIEVDSEPGRTTMRVGLPRRPARRHAADGHGQGGG